MELKNLPSSDKLNVLDDEVSFGGVTLKNRIAIHPMEGCDGTSDGKPDELTIRRYERFAKSGAGLVWLEAVAILKYGRANPRQLFLDENTKDSFKKLIDDIKNISVKENGFEPVIIMQATHSGRYSKPNGVPEPVIAYNNPLFEKDNPIDPSRIITDDMLFELEEQYGVAAKMAEEVGFDGIDIKCCHRYLGSELLSAYTREGAFGGSFDNRTRLLRNGIKNATDATSDKFIVTSRLNVYDGFEYPYGWGV
jgi:2,4-dienoyl-CoA reductase-like NADH-dependent reductase (Old Yellow Enzyme family)